MEHERGRMMAEALRNGDQAFDGLLAAVTDLIEEKTAEAIRQTLGSRFPEPPSGLRSDPSRLT
jgi:hypothetical protein